MKISRSQLKKITESVVTEVLENRREALLLRERDNTYVYTQKGEYIPCWSPETCEKGIKLSPSQKKDAEEQAEKTGKPATPPGKPAPKSTQPPKIQYFPPQNDADARKLAKIIATNYMADLPNDDRRSASVYLGTVHDHRGPDSILGDDDRVRFYVRYARGIAEDPRGRFTILRQELEKWAYSKIKKYMDFRDTKGKTMPLLKLRETPEYQFVFRSAEKQTPESRAFRTKTLNMFEDQGDKIIAAMRPGPNRKARLAKWAQMRASDKPATRPAKDAEAKRKAKRKAAKASRKKNRAGNRHDDLAESLLESLLETGFLRRLL